MTEEKSRDNLEDGFAEKPRPVSPAPPRPSASSATTNVANNPVLPVLAYCGSSILMTTTNKYVLSHDFNLNFFLLCVQVRHLSITLSLKHQLTHVPVRRMYHGHLRRQSPQPYHVP